MSKSGSIGEYVAIAWFKCRLVLFSAMSSLWMTVDGLAIPSRDENLTDGLPPLAKSAPTSPGLSAALAEFPKLVGK